MEAFLRFKRDAHRSLDLPHPALPHAEKGTVKRGGGDAGFDAGGLQRHLTTVKSIRVLLVQRDDLRRFSNLPDLAHSIAQAVAQRWTNESHEKEVPPSVKVAVEVVSFDGMSLRLQLLHLLAANVLVAVDGTGNRRLRSFLDIVSRVL